MKLNELPASPPGRKAVKRKGRGIGSGLGKTAGRGTKGQKSRSGGYHRVGFEGGQMPLQRRLPKRGFKSPFKKVFALIKVGDLEVFDAGTEVNAELLRERGLIGQVADGVKLLADGELTRALTIHVDKVSGNARAKVESAGGRVVVPEPTPADEES